MFTMPGVYKTVHPTVKGVESPTIDFAALHRRETEFAAMEAANAAAKKDLEKWATETKKKEMLENTFKKPALEQMKVNLLTKYQTMVEDTLLSEAFAYIYRNALPHDGEFIAEHFKAINSMGYMYIRKLGGLNYLKEQAAKTKSPFLNKLYGVIKEQAKTICENKAKKVFNAITDDEAVEIIKCKLDDKDKDELLKNIDNLGADELAELVKNKVIAVVKDEQQREKDDREFRTVLKNDMQDDLSPDSSELNASEDDEKEDDDINVSSIDTGDNMDDVESVDKSSADAEDKKSSKKKSDKKESEKPEVTSGDKEIGKTKKEPKKEVTPAKTPATGMESFTLEDFKNRWNPATRQFDYKPSNQHKSLLFAITTSVTRDMVKSASATEGTSITAANQKTAAYVLENPLNLDIFATFLKDNIGAIEDVERSEISNPQTLGSTAPMVDPSTIMTEALLQYTLLETAYTMKLITPSQKQIREQSEYLMNMR